MNTDDLCKLMNAESGESLHRDGVIWKGVAIMIIEALRLSGARLFVQMLTPKGDLIENIGINFIDSKIASPPSTDWISVDDRLPDEGQGVLSRMGNGKVYAGKYIHGGFYHIEFDTALCGYEIKIVEYFMDWKPIQRGTYDPPRRLP